MAVPRSLRLAAALVAVQSVALMVWGIVEVVRAFTGHPNDRGTAVFLGIIELGYGAFVGVTARGVAQARRWSQTPAYLVQFFSIVIGIGQLHTLAALMIPLIVIAAAALVALSWPASRERLGGV